MELEPAAETVRTQFELKVIVVNITKAVDHKEKEFLREALFLKSERFGLEYCWIREKSW